ncbi:MAG: Asp-tRNA(Asn)/Glu-tRNA(Gln) amidotransferase subunit GatB [Campylobacterales bacterium]|nr:Asp-tRNA(Asn)/Glu-tRNA(Gln) amidotransferase subunit GatB [Campylobacterales bacterium]
MEFEVVIGLEVHVQLNTKSKMFCSCPTSFGDEPNKNTCPVCLGLPGALPTPNKEALKKAVMFGKAVGSEINRKSIFDRKNYFYPDLPSGYQISQMPIPIVGLGKLNIDYEDGTSREIGVTRAHLEVDAGKNIHGDGHSKVDLNRAGTPLLEIVSEPDMRSSDEAVLYLKKLHSIVKYLGISDANMQEGSFRCDANVSIRPKGDEKLYTRVELKNINSFKFVQKAIETEIERQTEAWEDGEYDDVIYQETRLYDSAKNETRSMRGKEEAADYRYFPDPDLLEMVVDEDMEKETDNIPELPDEKKERYIKDFKVTAYDASVITMEIETANFFEDLMSKGVSGKNAVTWMTVELQGRLNKEGLAYENSPVSAEKLAELVVRIEDGTISAKAGKEVLDYLMENEVSVDESIDKLGLKQVSDDGAIFAIIDEVIAANPDNVERYKGGQEKLFGFFVGQVMKASKGSANPAKVNQLLKERLK